MFLIPHHVLVDTHPALHHDVSCAIAIVSLAYSQVQQHASQIRVILNQIIACAGSLPDGTQSY